MIVSIFLAVCNVAFSQTITEEGLPSAAGLFTSGLQTPATGGISPETARILAGLRSFFDSTADDVARRNTTSVGTACNSQETGWRDAVKKNVSRHGIGEVSDRCLTSVYHNASVAADLETLLRDAAGLFRDAALMGMRVHGKTATAMRDWEFSNGEQRCDFQRAAGVRANGHWYVLAGITNAPVQAMLRAGSREVLREYVLASSSGGPSLPVTVSVNGTRFRTTRLRVPGSAPAAAWHSTRLEHTPAMARALRRNAAALGQARDATTYSNIAIIFLPLGMAFVPVAFFAHAGRLRALVYILATDVLSVVPVLVKGFELLMTGTRRNREAASLVLGERELQVVETWVAVCTGRERLRRLGTAFVAVGVAVLVFGFVLEFAAQKFVRKRTREGGEVGTLGDMLLVPAQADTMPDRMPMQDNARINFTADLPAGPARAVLPGWRLRARGPR